MYVNPPLPSTTATGTMTYATSPHNTVAVASAMLSTL
jgi:hypothetical protein